MGDYRKCSRDHHCDSPDQHSAPKRFRSRSRNNASSGQNIRFPKCFRSQADAAIDELDELVKRVSGLEQSIEELKELRVERLIFLNELWPVRKRLAASERRG
jgi:hypothetical protein